MFMEMLIALIPSVLLVIGGIIMIDSRLTRIETNVKWIINMCKLCRKDDSDE